VLGEIPKHLGDQPFDEPKSKKRRALSMPFVPYWRLKVGDWRVVYRDAGADVVEIECVVEKKNHKTTEEALVAVLLPPIEEEPS
jgi:hypothetical protein